MGEVYKLHATARGSCPCFSPDLHLLHPLEQSFFSALTALSFFSKLSFTYILFESLTVAEMARSILLSMALFALRSLAQSGTAYTDPKSGIDFLGFTDPTSGSQFGIALPETSGTDFIGQIVAPVNSTGGWAGLDMGGEMTDYLLVVAWTNGDNVVSSLRKAS